MSEQEEEEEGKRLGDDIFNTLSRVTSLLGIDLYVKVEETPYCHGEPMQPTYRYKHTDGEIYRVFTCMLCNRHEEVEL